MSSFSFGQCLPNTITTIEGTNTLYACAADGKPDLFTFIKSDTTQLKYAYVVADGGDNILSIQKLAQINFDGNTPASFRVWGIVYSDSLIFKVGQDVTTIFDAKGCSRLSENVILVIRDVPVAESPSLLNGITDTTICFDNKRSDTLFFVKPARASSNQIFLITKFDGNIIDFFKGTFYSVDFLAKGDYSVYNMYYTGTLNISPNLSNIKSSNLSTGCFSIGSRAVQFSLVTINGGTLNALTQQSTFCPNGPKNVFFVRDQGEDAPLTSLILIDEKNICRSIAPKSSIVLSGLVPGDYKLRSISYSGQLFINIGDTVIPTVDKTYSSDCYAWASGSIDIRIALPQAGKIVTSTGDTALFACPGDRLPDRFTFNAMDKSSSNYAILIINDKNKIVGITTPGGSFDFEGSALGKCKAYGLSYTGVLLAALDSLISAKMSSDCFELTPNFITITKGTIKGGTISLTGGGTTYYTCPDHNDIRKILLDKKNTSESAYQYVLTSDAGNIVAFVEKDSISFKNISLTSLRLYGVAYSGKRIISTGNNMFFTSFSDGCFSISDNFIRVVNEKPRGGGLRLPDGSNKELFCPSDPAKKVIQLRNVDVSSNLYSFVITDSMLTVIDITANFTYNFDSLPLGQYFIYGVSYIGNPVITKGSKLDLNIFSDDCFSYSSVRIEVVIGQIDGGTLTSSEGTTNVFTCPGNFDQDIIQIIPLKARSLGYRYVLTNDQNVILGYSISDQIDFGAGPINLSTRVYGVAYKGDFIPTLNRDIFQTAFSTSCYDLSDNYIRVKEIIPPAHKLLSSLKDSIVTICIGDSVANLVTVSTSDSLGLKTVILGIEDSKITKIYDSKVLNFEKDSVGIIRLYSLIFTGKLLAKVGLTFVPGLALTDDCFSLSSNSIVVDKVRTGPFCVITSANDESWVRGFKLYPNPVINSVFNLEWSALEPKITQREYIDLYLLDINGKVIMTLKLNPRTANSIQIPVTGIQSGMYMLKLQAGGRMIVRKLIIGL